MSASIELFHLYFAGWDLGNNMEYFLNELLRADAYIRKSQQSNVIMVMLDDQSVSRKFRASFFAPIIGWIASAIPVDFITFETDLNIGVKDWLALQSNADALNHSIKYEYNHQPQCSHYIAIWYLMRLGLIPHEKEFDGEKHSVFIPMSTRALKFEVSPVQHHLVNYLSEKYQDVEDMTKKDILAYNKYADELEHRIQRVYFKE